MVDVGLVFIGGNGVWVGMIDGGVVGVMVI